MKRKHCEIGLLEHRSVAWQRKRSFLFSCYKFLESSPDLSSGFQSKGVSFFLGMQIFELLILDLKTHQLLSEVSFSLRSPVQFFHLWFSWSDLHQQIKGVPPLHDFQLEMRSEVEYFDQNKCQYSNENEMQSGTPPLHYVHSKMHSEVECIQW